MGHAKAFTLYSGISEEPEEDLQLSSRVLSSAFRRIPQEADWMAYTCDGDTSKEAAGHPERDDSLNKAVGLDMGKSPGKAGSPVFAH